MIQEVASQILGLECAPDGPLPQQFCAYSPRACSAEHFSSITPDLTLSDLARAPSSSSLSSSSRSRPPGGEGGDAQPILMQAILDEARNHFTILRCYTSASWFVGCICTCQRVPCSRLFSRVQNVSQACCSAKSHAGINSRYEHSAAGAVQAQNTWGQTAHQGWAGCSPPPPPRHCCPPGTPPPAPVTGRPGARQSAGRVRTRCRWPACGWFYTGKCKQWACAWVRL